MHKSQVNDLVFIDEHVQVNKVRSFFRPINCLTVEIITLGVVFGINCKADAITFGNEFWYHSKELLKFYLKTI